MHMDFPNKKQNVLVIKHEDFLKTLAPKKVYIRDGNFDQLS